MHARIASVRRYFASIRLARAATTAAAVFALVAAAMLSPPAARERLASTDSAVADAVALPEQGRMRLAGAIASPSVRNGRLAMSGGVDPYYIPDRIVQVYPDGVHPRQRVFGEWAQAPTYSPDGSRIAFQLGMQPDIATMNVFGSDLRVLTRSPAHDGQPAYSPSGRRIAFLSVRTGSTTLWIMRADGTNQHQVVPAGTDLTNVAWSPNGRQLVFGSYFDLERKFQAEFADLWSIRPDGTGLRRLTDRRGNDFYPAFSPDGASIVYVRQSLPPPGTRQLWIMAADGTDKRLLTDRVGTPPVWSPDGRWIAFLNCRPDWAASIGFIRPEGNGFRCQRVGPPGYDVHAASDTLTWQPWPGTSPSRVLLDSVRHDMDSVRVRGHVRAGYTGHRVQAVLLRSEVDGQLHRVDSASTLTRHSERSFGFSLDRPARGMCVLRVRYTGDHDHLPSHTRRRLQC